MTAPDLKHDVHARRFPGSLVLGVVRAQAVLLQGIWFVQIAQILFRGAQPSLSECRHASMSPAFTQEACCTLLTLQHPMQEYGRGRRMVSQCVSLHEAYGRNAC